MKTFSLPYGNANLSFSLPESAQIDEILPHPFEVAANIKQQINDSLGNPLGSSSLDLFSRDSTVAIAINDKTRPIPKPNPLRHLLDHLEKLGFDREKITLFISSGTHIPMTEAENAHLLDEDILADYRVIVHDCDHSPMVNLGKTAYNTPIQINQGIF